MLKVSFCGIGKIINKVILNNNKLICMKGTCDYLLYQRNKPMNNVQRNIGALLVAFGSGPGFDTAGIEHLSSSLTLLTIVEKSK